jgi:hypothetical protein
MIEKQDNIDTNYPLEVLSGDNKEYCLLGYKVGKIHFERL